MAITELAFTIQLAHNNIVPGSETVTLPGNQYKRFFRADPISNIPGDYTLDYTNGILRFVDGSELQAIAPSLLDVSYRYKIDFAERAFLKSQLEVFGEIATFIPPNQLRVKNKPIEDIIRIQNLITNEIYTANSASDDIIQIGGNSLPKIESFVDLNVAPTDILLTQLRTDGRFDQSFNLPLAPGFEINTTRLSSIEAINKTTKARRLVIGGIDEINTSIIFTLTVPNDIVDIIFYTGATSLRRSNIRLKKDTDYTLTLVGVTTPAFSMLATITFTTTGLAKIQAFDVYYVVVKKTRSLSFAVDSTSGQTVVNTTNSMISEEIVLSGDIGSTTLISQALFINTVNNINTYQRGNIIVSNTTRQVVFTENIDFTLSDLGVFTRTANSQISPNEVIIVQYLDDESTTIDYTLLAEPVAIDYIYGNNTIDWSGDTTDEIVIQTVQLSAGEALIGLESDLVDLESVLIYRTDDSFKNIVARGVKYTEDIRELQITPIAESGTYNVEYQARFQTFEVGKQYYASYNYGSRRDMLVRNWAPLLDIQSQDILRQDEFDITPFTVKVVLGYIPINFQDVVIYDEGDPTKSPVTSVKDFNPVTKELTIYPVTTPGTRIFEYLSSGFETNSLRQAVKGLLSSYLIGPTTAGFTSLVESFTGIAPTLVEASTDSFKLGKNGITADNYLVNGKNYTQGINFSPSSFNTGVKFTTAESSLMKVQVANNFPIIEGTVEFLVGPLFNGNDNQEHYFIDLYSGDPNRNRLSLYKNKNNRLTFEIRDNNGEFYKTSVDVTKMFITECVYLVEGQTTIDFKSQLTCDGDRLRKPVKVLPSGTVFVKNYGAIADGYQILEKTDGYFVKPGYEGYYFPPTDGYLHSDDGYLHVDGYDGYPDQYGTDYLDGYYDGYPDNNGYGPIWIAGQDGYFQITGDGYRINDGYTVLVDGYDEEQAFLLMQDYFEEYGYNGVPLFIDAYGPTPTHTNVDIDSSGQDDLFQALDTKFLIYPESDLADPNFRRQNKIRALSYDKQNEILTIEPIPVSGNYIISYVTGFTAYEEPTHMIGITWNLRSTDGEPYLRLYLDGKRQASPVFLNYKRNLTYQGS